MERELKSADRNALTCISVCKSNDVPLRWIEANRRSASLAAQLPAATKTSLNCCANCSKNSRRVVVGPLHGYPNELKADEDAKGLIEEIFCVRTSYRVLQKTKN